MTALCAVAACPREPGKTRLREMAYTAAMMATRRAPLDEAQRSALAAARARWPEFSVEDDDFLKHIERHLGPEQSLDEALRSLHLADLYCALACARGEPRALTCFDREFLRPGSSALSRIDPAPEFAAEVKQLVRQKLLLPVDGGEPRIADYAGRGPLLHWVRTALSRAALNAKRDHQRDRCASAQPLIESDLPAYDPEALSIKEDYRLAFQNALRAALGTLPRRDRSVLRLHLLEGLNLDRIGIVYNVHRATVARWLAQARAALRDAVLAQLSRELGLPAEEVERSIGLVSSQLDLSVSRLLRTGPEVG
jgi:RNA polymerase sigma-70 factor (ECF subfamily)